MPVERVHVGEVVCSKREPFYAHRLGEVIERWIEAAKKLPIKISY